ncbi:hypothetical protein K0M31_018185 [Melipona bicolor]|uniref:Uncharacterized protein n=1 Tax=Melipona bicolor TaxID=60889 RepID=A0AA40FCZ2_9HYME|nr:hypothetical protein K0M31_018185 [Melipona bicolor]
MAKRSSGGSTMKVAASGRKTRKKKTDNDSGSDKREDKDKWSLGLGGLKRYPSTGLPILERLEKESPARRERHDSNPNWSYTGPPWSVPARSGECGVETAGGWIPTHSRELERDRADLRLSENGSKDSHLA